MTKEKASGEIIFLIHSIELSQEQVKFIESETRAGVSFEYVKSFYEITLKQNPKGWTNGNFSGGLEMGIAKMSDSEKSFVLFYTREINLFPTLH